MDNELKILILEDVAPHAQLMERELRKAGMHFLAKRVETEETFLKELQEFKPDLILADYSLPKFDGMSALSRVQEDGSNVPFIFVSGAIGEELAIDTLKKGATDYVLKHRLSRLAPAVRRAVQEAEVRKARKKAEEALRKAHNELEIRVKERTAELSKTNEELKKEIAERKRAEALLKKSEEQYRVLYEEAPLAYFSIDIDGHIRMVNTPAVELLGYPERNLIDQSIFMLYADTPTGKEKAQKLFQEFLAGKEIRGEELEMRTLDGRSVWVSLTVRPIRDAEGQIVESHSMLVDITERKRAERAVRESEERLSSILESAMDAIVTIDENLNILLFNQAAEKVFRCSSAEAMDTSLDRFLSENFCKLLISYLQDSGKRRKSRQYMWAAEGLTAIRSDGEEFPAEATISEVDVAGQKLYTLILRDINDRKQAEAELNKLQLQNIYLQEQIESEYNFEEIVGASAAMKGVFKNIEKVAATDSTVLLSGETGTGKELIARAIHNLSSRKNNVLIKVNCGALPSGLVESELFGHEKGAFTGATTAKKGRFELADGGTIFLDEVGELPLDTQTKLLRVLEQQEFERVGGTQSINVNVRVIAATNRDLEEAIKQETFRSDLYYRLNIFPIRIPPLRERHEDVPLLTNHFIKKFSHRIGKSIESITPQALSALQRYNWPGNVRELANILERAVILCEDNVLKPEHISISAQQSVTKDKMSTLEEAEREHIQQALEKTGGLVGGPKGAAELLGLKRTTLLTKMKKLGIG